MPRRRVRAEARARYFVRNEAAKRGWRIEHLDRGGDFLEEQEITARFPEIGLGLTKPDFIVCLYGEPVMVVETKNEAGRSREALSQAIEYADTINQSERFDVRVAVGASGEQDEGYVIEAHYLTPDRGWQPLASTGEEITNVPSKREVELAIAANDASTEVSVPTRVQFIDAAIELSHIMRRARIEAQLRPKVIGSLVLAMYRGEIDATPPTALDSINRLVAEVINESRDLTAERRAKWLDALRLSGADFDRLAPHVGRLVSILRRLNVRAVIHTEADFLGEFYEAFLRYGYDNKALGIVFTPRHITRYCVALAGVKPSDRVADIACGTGGFLVGAFDQMMKSADGVRAREQIKSAIYGCDTNPTVWALAMVNMFVRGDGKANIDNDDSLDVETRRRTRGRFTRAFLNPPFSQDQEPEHEFVDASLEALEVGGRLAAVVKAGIFADAQHSGWRREFCRRHRLIGVISLPEDLFYPTAAPTSIIVADAHRPLRDRDRVFMARVWNDGFEKLKGRRVERAGSQLDEVRQALTAMIANRPCGSELATTVEAEFLRDGAEFSPQNWLPQPRTAPDEHRLAEEQSLASLFRAVAQVPDLAGEVLADFGSAWQGLPPLPLGDSRPIKEFFVVQNGKSIGEKNYSDGSTPYVSSGDQSNSIVRLILAEEGETFAFGGITVTAFGHACIQPWPFAARGNGGSSVRVLTPRFAMGLPELLWFAAEINLQRWRFHYARMAIKSRLERLVVTAPLLQLPDHRMSLHDRIRQFGRDFIRLTSLDEAA